MIRDELLAQTYSSKVEVNIFLSYVFDLIEFNKFRLVA